MIVRVIVGRPRQPQQPRQPRQPRSATAAAASHGSRSSHDSYSSHSNHSATILSESTPTHIPYYPALSVVSSCTAWCHPALSVVPSCSAWCHPAPSGGHLQLAIFLGPALLSGGCGTTTAMTTLEKTPKCKIRHHHRPHKNLHLRTSPDKTNFTNLQILHFVIWRPPFNVAKARFRKLLNVTQNTMTTLKGTGKKSPLVKLVLSGLGRNSRRNDNDNNNEWSPNGLKVTATSQGKASGHARARGCQRSHRAQTQIFVQSGGSQLHHNYPNNPTITRQLPEQSPNNHPNNNPLSYL